jgi:hypothetical protein
MIIRAKNFRSWFNANLRCSARDIASHGADCGYPCITYTSDTVRIFDRFAREIWDMAVEEAAEIGCKNSAGLEYAANNRLILRKKAENTLSPAENTCHNLRRGAENANLHP